MCGIMVNIESGTAEIMRGKKIEEERKKEETQGKNIMSASATQGGHNKAIETSPPCATRYSPKSTVYIEAYGREMSQTGTELKH